MDLQRQVIVQLKYWVYFCRAVLARHFSAVYLCDRANKTHAEKYIARQLSRVSNICYLSNIFTKITCNITPLKIKTLYQQRLGVFVFPNLLLSTMTAFGKPVLYESRVN